MRLGEILANADLTEWANRTLREINALQAERRTLLDNCERRVPAMQRGSQKARRQIRRDLDRCSGELKTAIDSRIEEVKRIIDLAETPEALRAMLRGKLLAVDSQHRAGR